MAYKWKPLQPAELPPLDLNDPVHRYFIEQQMADGNCSREHAIKKLLAYEADCRYWRNDLYQVQVRYFHNEAFKSDMVHINIRRLDGAAIFDWRHRQLIKNQLVGPECEAFEIYPAESRLVDTSNKYHLWAFIDPTIRLPVGIDGEQGRDVITSEVRFPAGARQRGISNDR
jgi:hypothetical protein